MREYIVMLGAVLLAPQLSLAATAEADRLEYPDVPREHWASEAVHQLSGRGIIEGMPNGTYAGGRAMTRYEVSMVLTRINIDEPAHVPTTQADREAMELRPAAPVPDGRDPHRIEYAEYPDVPRRHWANKSIADSSRMGVIEGLPDGTFGATRPLTRYECAVALARWIECFNRGSRTVKERIATVEKQEMQVVTPYLDVPQTHWAFHAVSRLNQLGLLKGFNDGRFRGQQAMTRYEFAVIMSRAMSIILPG